MIHDARTYVLAGHPGSGVLAVDGQSELERNRTRVSIPFTPGIFPRFRSWRWAYVILLCLAFQFSQERKYGKLSCLSSLRRCVHLNGPHSTCTADSQSTPRHAHAPHSRELSPDEHVEVELPRVTTVIAPYDVAPN